MAGSTEQEKTGQTTAPTDEATQLVARKAERALLWKVDCLLMPLLTVSFGLQYYDKAVLGSASIFGIIKDLHLSTTSHGVTSTIRYSTANSAFYWGYIVAVLPIALFLQRLPLARSLAAVIFLWGVTVILTVVVTTYQGLVVQRVFLGVLESAVSPGFVLLTSQWYTKSEQATRLGIWYSSTGLFSIFSGVVNYGLGSAGGSLAPWKYMYLFAGAWTILWALVVLYFVPDSPATSHRWFNESERAILVARTRSNMSGAVEPSKFRWSHAKEAILDVKIWIFLLMGASIYVCNGGVTAFGARIVSSFGYSSLTTIVILIPGGAFTAVSIYLFAWLSGRYKNTTTYLIPISCVPIIVGSVIIWKASWAHRGVPLFGYYLLPCFGAPYVLLLALSTTNVAGSTKKAISAGAVFIGYNVGNIIGPYLVFTPEKAIHYRSTWISIIVCMCVTSALSILLRFVLQRENARRDALGLADDEDEAALGEKSEREDWSDGENLRFRYRLLPREMLYSILHHGQIYFAPLEPRDLEQQRTAFFSNAALVCRDWRSIAQELLFGRASLESGQCAQKYLRMIKSGRWRTSALHVAGDRAGDRVDADTLAEILRSLPELKELSLRDMELLSPLTISHLHTLTSLVLDLIPIASYPPTTKPFTFNLSTLAVRSWYSTDMFPLLAPSVANLENLTLINEHNGFVPVPPQWIPTLGSSLRNITIDTPFEDGGRFSPHLSKCPQLESFSIGGFHAMKRLVPEIESKLRTLQMKGDCTANLRWVVENLELPCLGELQWLDLGVREEEEPLSTREMWWIKEIEDRGIYVSFTGYQESYLLPTKEDMAARWSIGGFLRPWWPLW
ncbi:hypothetical protein MNV49_006451 [Pseudohyphozyma bogoriensis]|nr:hypothetical protein MNV49_006451 [Pseudohyphozyma bogoriensis]